MQPEPAKEKYQPFMTDIQEIHRRAREHMEKDVVNKNKRFVDHA